MLRALVLFALLAPSVAHSLTFTSAHAIHSRFEAFVQIRVSDGALTFYDTTIGRPSRAANVDLFVEETGVEGILDPRRTFSGNASISPDSLEWTGVPGLASGQTFSLIWDTMRIDVTGEPIAKLRTSLASYSEPVSASMTASGGLHIGGDLYPVSLPQEWTGGMSSGTHFTGSPYLAWGFGSGGGGHDLFSIQRDGLTYTGELFFTAYITVPEPGTAILIGLGLAGLSASRGRTHRHT